ncbi:MAG: 7-cyano-7-deazaguanine synthase QueC [Candidatus Altiarchaeales archaeon]|nr:7-cyano-7-deazaguanine synthase QueC [Candidatus Altiarchaeales archaeon]
MGSEKAVVLLSGGLDSAVTAYQAKSEVDLVYPLTVCYGQRHSREIDCARKIAEKLKTQPPRIIEIDPALLASSSLTDKSRKMPVDRTQDEIGEGGIPNTYVPARNAVMLVLALSYAESIGAREVYIGAHTLDYSGYPDCRPEFIEAFQRMADLATKAGVEGNPITIRAPLINMDKTQIISFGASLGVPFELTTSCYFGARKACGRCDSCRLRLKGFRGAGLVDPVEYE